MTRPSRPIQYRESAKNEFGDLRVIHLGDLTSIETQIAITEGELVYGMRLGWKWYTPPLKGELVSLHLPQSKSLVRVVRVKRTCVCCPHGKVNLYVEPVAGILSEMTSCECTKKRTMRNDSVGWRSFDEETECLRRKRGVLRKVSDVINGEKNEL